MGTEPANGTFPDGRCEGGIVPHEVGRLYSDELTKRWEVSLRMEDDDENALLGWGGGLKCLGWSVCLGWMCFCLRGAGGRAVDDG